LSGVSAGQLEELQLQLKAAMVALIDGVFAGSRQRSEGAEKRSLRVCGAVNLRWCCWVVMD
jgi:hypothetical protein